MNYKVTAFIDNKKIESENIMIKNKSVYEIINKYMRAKKNRQNNLKVEERVMNL